MNARNATLTRRLAAVFYDSLLLFALFMLATTPFVAGRHGELVSPGTLSHQLTLLAVAYAYFVGFWSRRGGTTGMVAWRLRVESRDGGLPSLRQATVRFLAAIVSFAAFGLGFLWSLWDREGLAWHDRLSGTRLVHYPKPGNSADSA